MNPLCPNCERPGLADRLGNVWCANCGEANPMRPEDRDTITREVLELTALHEHERKARRRRKVVGRG